MPYFIILPEKHSKAHPSRGQSLRRVNIPNAAIFRRKIDSIKHLSPDPKKTRVLQIFPEQYSKKK